MKKDRTAVRVYVARRKDVQDDLTAIVQTVFAVTAFVGLLFAFMFGTM